MNNTPGRQVILALTLAALSVALGGLLSGAAVTPHASAQADPCPNSERRAEQQVAHLPDCRAYEMVTPADKNNRRLFDYKTLSHRTIGNWGIASADGESVLIDVWAGVVNADAGTAFPHFADFALLTRKGSEHHWSVESVNNTIAVVPAGDGPLGSPEALSGDLLTQAWWHKKPLFESHSPLSTRIFGDDRGGLDGSGWYDWVADPAIAARLTTGYSDSGLIDDEGRRMLRWGNRYTGLLGPGDPSSLQLPPAPAGCGAGNCSYPGGAAIYMQEPPGSGPRHLVNECTDREGETEIPARIGSGDATDEIGDQACGEGSPTSLRGAVVGSGSVAVRAMSKDGSRVFFTSPDPGVAPSACTESTGSGTNCPAQLFVRQHSSDGEAIVRWISRSQVTQDQRIGLLRRVYYEGASSDGRYVFFRTDAPLTDQDPNGGESITEGPASAESWDLYRYELPADPDQDPAGGDLIRISGGNSAGADPNVTGAGNPTAARYISEDGKRVYFVTRGVIGDGDADNTPPSGSAASNLPGGDPSTSETRNLYLFDQARQGAERWRFIARLPYTTSNAIDACATSGRISGMPQNTEGSLGDLINRNGSHSCVRGTPDGGAIAFETTAKLTADDTDSAGDIYLYDAEEHALTRVSAPPAGIGPYRCNDGGGTAPVEDCNADFGFEGRGKVGERVGLNGHYNTNLTLGADGEISVFFQSRLPLTEDDDNDLMDVYEWRGGELSLISPGSDGHAAWFVGNSHDGSSVFFFTSEPLDPREIDAADYDIYVARIGGGFPAPPSPPARCDAFAGECLDQAPSEPQIPEMRFKPSEGNVAAPPVTSPGRCRAVVLRARAFRARALAVRRAARRAERPQAKRRFARRARVMQRHSRALTRRATVCRQSVRRAG